MENTDTRSRGIVWIDANECKGCGLCILACPPKVMALTPGLNHHGYRTAQYSGSGCTACGICFLACPEPGAITILRQDRVAASQQHSAQGEL